MPSPFDITTSTNTLTLDNNRKGVAVFTVKNLTRRNVHAHGEAKTDPPDGTKWLTFLPLASAVPDTNAPNARDIPVDGDTTFQIQVAVPVDAPAGSFKLRLKVAEELNPDENFSESPDVVFTVREIPKPVPRPFPIWIIPAILIVVIVIVAIVVIAVTSGNNEQSIHETATAVAIAQMTEDATQAAFQTQTQSAISDLQTSAANSNFSNQTLSAAISMTAAQNVALTQTAAAQTAAAQTAAAQTAAAQTLAASQTHVAETIAAQTAAAQTLAASQTHAAQTAIASQTHAAQTAIAQQTQTVLNTILGDWVGTDSGGKSLGLRFTDAGSNKVDLVATVQGDPDAFKITGIPFSPTQLVAASGNLVFTFQRVNDNQLLVTGQVGNLSPTHVLYHRKLRLETFPIANVNVSRVLQNVQLSQSQMNQLSIQIVATPTPKN